MQLQCKISNLMSETVLPPLSRRGGSSEILTVTPRLQTLGLMKPTRIIQQKLSQEKSKWEAGHAGCCPTLPVISMKPSAKSRSLPLNRPLVCSEMLHGRKRPGLRKLSWKFTLDVSSLLQEPKGLWKLCGTSSLQQWIPTLLCCRTGTVLDLCL